MDEANGRGSKERVLVVEDNAVTRRLLQRMLQEQYEVAAAPGVEEALRQARGERYDTVVLDIDLGERRTGVELMHLLRRRPAYRDVTFVACTAYALPGLRDRLIEAGFDGYINKPFSRKQLLEALAQAQNGATAPDEYGDFEEQVAVQMPPAPTTVPAVAELMAGQEEGRDVERLREVLEHDPVTSAWVLRHVNTAFYSVRRRVTSVDHAIVMLGFDPVCQLVLAGALSRAVPDLADEHVRRVYRTILRTSLAAAALARRLAEECDVARPATAFTAGLLMQVGRLALLSTDANRYASMWEEAGSADALHPPTSGKELIHFGHDYVSLSGRVAEHWHLPEALRAVLRLHRVPESAKGRRERRMVLLSAVALARAYALVTEVPPGEQDDEERHLQELARTCGVDVRQLRAHLHDAADQAMETADALLESA